MDILMYMFLILIIIYVTQVLLHYNFVYKIKIIFQNIIFSQINSFQKFFSNNKMLNGKFLLTIFAILIAVMLFFKSDFNTPIVENWNVGKTTVTAMPVAISSDGRATNFSGNFYDPSSTRGSGKFVSTPSFQGVLAPRFSNVQYGANIKYNMPDRENLGSPCNPLTFGDMAKENYSTDTKENYGCGTGQCGTSAGVPSCGKGGYGLGHKVGGGYELPTGYANGNYNDVYNTLHADGKTPEQSVVSQPCTDNPTSASLPVGTMTTMDSVGNPEQYVVMNRLMNTSMNSRLRAQGDPIRGDLAITPCQSGWFSVYPTINVDLQPGALNVLAGHQAGESNSKLMELLVNASGGSRTTFGGVDFSDAPSVNMTPQYGSLVSSASTDVNVTAFP
jgi:hypothetical protein